MIRPSLFVKILVSFWLTLATLGVLLTLLLGSSSREERLPAELATSFLALLEETLERDGLAAAERQRSLIKRTVRERISIVAEMPGGSARAGEGATLRRASTPDGRTFVLRYDPATVGMRPDVPAYALVGGVIAGVIFSIALAVYLTRPLRLLRNGLERLAGGDLNVRLSGRVGRRKDEVADLARDFDSMAERLGQLVSVRDRLLNDVSHELRSPLTRLQLAIGLARQDPARTEASLTRIEREAHRLELLVAELLTLARAESGADVSDVFFDPVGVLVAVVADAGLEAHEKRCRVALIEPGPGENERPVVAGSIELFRRATENVLRNAIRFAPADSVVLLKVDILASPLRYRVSIRDQGPGVQPDLIAVLFEPFVRADQSGTGLGLTIAKRAIQAHGGTIDCRNHEDGGFLVEIVVPAQPSAE